MTHDISRETFEKADTDTKMLILFDMTHKIYNKVDQNQCLYLDHLGSCNERFKAIEARKRRDTTISGILGIFGGFIAMIIIWLKEHV